jgi:uncharacterized protein (DUF849 family)
MIVNIALTGVIPTKRDNVALPITPDEIIRDAINCADAGAAVVHIHARDEQGRPTHRRDLYERIIGGLRSARPELIICVTTSSRVATDPESRMVGLKLDADLRPDLASLTLGSYNTPGGVNVNPPDTMVALLEQMGELGIRPELEVFEFGMVNTLYALRERGLISDPPLVNILLGLMGAAPAFVGDLARMVERLPDGTEWAAAGIGRFQRPMTIAASIMDGNVRTGLEDNPRPRPDGVWTNVDAVRFAAEAAALSGRTLASPSEARQRFGLIA